MDKLLVWGDQPSIYLYAEREAFDPDYLFLYAHNLRIHDPREERRLLDSLRENPPAWIAFYNYKFDDGWTMNRLTQAIGIPYSGIQRFRMIDTTGQVMRTPNGVALDFPLYRRDDRIYKEILVDKAIAALAEKRIEKATAHLEKALQLYPGDYETTLRLSLANGDDAGILDQREDLQRQPAKPGGAERSAVLLKILAETDLRGGHCDSALKRYVQARELQPEDFRIYNGLGEACLHIGKDQQALTFFKRALDLNPFSADAYNNMGVLLLRAGRTEEAKSCFVKSLAIIPDHPDTLSNLEALNRSVNS
jgi:Flp pilus assembly protein TadD